MLASRRLMAIVAISLIAVLLSIFGATASKSNAAIIGLGVQCTITASTSWTPAAGPKLPVVNGIGSVKCNGIVALISMTVCVMRDNSPVACSSDVGPAGFGISMTVRHSCGYTTYAHQMYATVAARIVGVFGGVATGAVSGGFFTPVPHCY